MDLTPPSELAPPGPGLLLVRHGQSTWNHAGRWQGIADPELSTVGTHQARDAAEKLTRADPPFDIVYSSPLRRAAATAGIIAHRLGVDPPTPVPGIAERDVGQWAGLTHAEIDARWPGWRGPPRRDPPGGETQSETVARLRKALGWLADDLGGRRGIAVAHGGVIRGIETILGVDRGEIPNLVAWWLPLTSDIAFGPTGWRGGGRGLLVCLVCPAAR